MLGVDDDEPSILDMGSVVGTVMENALNPFSDSSSSSSSRRRSSGGGLFSSAARDPNGYKVEGAVVGVKAGSFT